jgi:fructosamine-3-kinase
MRDAPLPRELAERLEAALGHRPLGARTVSGGSICEARIVTLDGGPTIFVKSHASLDPSAFELEARGLVWLAEAGTIAVPKVLACSNVGSFGPGFLALELVESGGRPDRLAEERLGRGLAALHRFGAPSYGLDHDNLLATLPQHNRPTRSWASFYRERRLEPLAERARRKRLLGPRIERRLEALYARLDELVGPEEPPSRLHGDLWGGNWLVARGSTPYLIDPAVYGGHREIDLAMMQLFGGFGARVFAAYDEAYPRSPGHEARVALHQLYPLLAHVVMFGGSYVAQLDEALSSYV